MMHARQASFLLLVTTLVLGLCTQLANTAAWQQVNVTFYGESLCPFCRQLTVGPVSAFFKAGLANLTNFEYVPYGNARQTQDGVVCQHGEGECRLNRVFACAIHQRPSQNDWFPFLFCLENSQLARASPGGSGDAPGGFEPQIKSCARTTGFDTDALEACARGKQGDELIAAAAARTAALDPPHTYVPWLTVQGYPLGDATNLLDQFVCMALPQSERPPACFKSLKGASLPGLPGRGTAKL